MTLGVGILRETAAGERRVALSPSVAGKLADLGCAPRLAAGAGAAAGIPDSAYAPLPLVADNAAALAGVGLVLCVQMPEAALLDRLSANTVLIGLLAPYRHPREIQILAKRGVTSFAMELVPRISRAQSMDALSSQAAVAGYRGALLAAQLLPRFFPMLTTAAGTIRPARVLVIGAGVAGLQAIATARRLGAQVEAFDVRAAAREQVESLGAKFVDTGVFAEGAGGYARELTAEEKARQQEALAKTIAAVDAVISTAAVPGRPAPKIISAAMVAAMKSGSVIVDLAAESGGNCELTRPGETLTEGPCTIIGPLNVPSTLAEHASDMYARNLLHFVTPLLHDGALRIDWDDEVYKTSVLTHDGKIMHEPTRQMVEQ